jgi:subtilisin family serine protease
MRANVVNNSWGDCEQTYNDWYEAVINAWHAAGIYPVFSNGNNSNCRYSYPPGLNTVGNPARSGNVTGVGSSGRNNGLYAFHSNWGPTDNLDTINSFDGFPAMKPQVIAPGVGIRSSTPGNDSAYGSKNGTSMSAPHVAGTVALIMHAAPCLRGNYAVIETILEGTATPIIYDDGSPLTPTNYPNFATGWGEINALAAVQAAQGMCNNNSLHGRITNNLGQPIANAKLQITGSQNFNRRTIYSYESGNYSTDLKDDVYSIQISADSYQTVSENDISLASGTTLEMNFVLPPEIVYILHLPIILK